MTYTDASGDRMKHDIDSSSRLGAGTDLLEAVAELAERHGREGALGVHHQRAVLQAVHVAHDDQQVRRRLDGQEASRWYVHACNNSAHC